jgi:hypothetical protein
MRQTAWVATISLVLIASGTTALAADSAPASAPAAAGAVQPGKYFVDNVDRSQGKALESAVRSASAPLDLVAAKLALANWHLAVPTAGPATRVLLGLATANDTRQLRESTQAAQQQLEGIGKTLDQVPPGDRRRELRQSSVILTAFAKAMASVSGQDRSGCSDAAVDLASVRESDNPEVAAAALLWQSYAWECAGRRERALSTLPPVLEKPAQPSYDFIARLLRCRILSDAGENTAALAVTIRMAAMADRWFPRTGDETLQPRVRLIALLQTELGRRWLGDSGAGKLDAEAARKVQTIIDAAREKLNSDSQPLPVYQLETAMPILVQPPKPVSQPAAAPPASRPASQPTTSPQ